MSKSSKEQIRAEANVFTTYAEWDTLPTQTERLHEPSHVTERQRMIERAIAAGDNSLARALLSMPV